MVRAGLPVARKKSWTGGAFRAHLSVAVCAMVTLAGNPSVLTQTITCTLVTDSLQKTVPNIIKPDYLQAYIDPVFGSLVTRVTGDPGTTILNVGGVWGDVARHGYSKDPAWSSDQALLVLKRVPGVAGTMFLDGTTYRPLFVRSSPGGETRWHPSIPDVMIYLTYACEFGHWNVRTDVRNVIYTAAGYNDCYMGPWEGNASYDGRFVAAYARRISDGRRVAFAVDLAQRTRYPDLDLAVIGVSNTDWVSVSASGTYLVVTGTISGCSTVGGYCDATKVFTLAGNQVGPFWSEYGVPSHYDLGIDAEGNDVAVGVSKTAPTEGKVIMRRLRDGVITVLNVGGYASHTSTRNVARPGWAYVSHPYNGPYWPPFRNEVFAVKLDGSQTIQRLAHLHTTPSFEDAHPTATPSPDGTRVIFASNWSTTTGLPVQAYVADTRGSCPAPPAPVQNVRIIWP